MGLKKILGVVQNKGSQETIFVESPFVLSGPLAFTKCHMDQRFDGLTGAVESQEAALQHICCRRLYTRRSSSLEASCQTRPWLQGRFQDLAIPSRFAAAGGGRSKHSQAVPMFATAFSLFLPIRIWTSGVPPHQGAMREYS